MVTCEVKVASIVAFKTFPALFITMQPTTCGSASMRDIVSSTSADTSNIPFKRSFACGNMLGLLISISFFKLDNKQYYLLTYKSSFPVKNNTYLRASCYTIHITKHIWSPWPFPHFSLTKILKGFYSLKIKSLMKQKKILEPIYWLTMQV